ncbi:sigma factor-like helix-turn-helix DNA-binding protein [Streptomyces sp. NPDC058657]|uniref:sigma factor-like helix-turn-helix DNA-binding protein n=1 Tax=unclassified Streptomyces TaxID=2593676 RepID=UPI003657DD02
MSEREEAQQRRRAREFEAFVAGATGRLLHAATLLTAEPADANPRAQRLLAAALTTTYARWESLRGEDPYDRTRQALATRFARGSWHHRPRRGPRHGGPLEVLGPRARLIVVLRLYEGIPQEQTAALLGLPERRVRTLCARAVARVYEDTRARERAEAETRERESGSGGPLERGPGAGSRPVAAP